MRPWKRRVRAAVALSPAAITQTHARFRNDDGSESTATWRAAEDTNISLGKGLTFRVRIQADYASSGSLTSSIGFKIRYSKNGGAWTDVTTSSSNVKAVATSQGYSNHASTTRQLSIPNSHTFGGGEIQTNDGATASDITENVSTFFELEYCLQLVSADIAVGDTLDFRCESTGRAFNTYTVVPRITVGSSNKDIASRFLQAVQAGFSWRRTITFDHSKVANTDQTDFPALVSLSLTDLKTVANGGKVSNSNGYDIQFWSDSSCSQRLNWEVEKYSASGGTLIAWVRIPTLSHSADTVIYMTYGDSLISAFQGNKVGTWESNFALVAHMGDGTTFDAADSTGGNTPTSTGVLNTAGEIGGAGAYNGSSSDINYGSGTANVSSGDLTCEAWIKLNNNSSEHKVLARWGGSGLRQYLLSISGTIVAAEGNGSTIAIAVGGTTLSSGVWYHVALVKSGSNLYAYLNGVQDGSTTSASLASTLSSTRVGRDEDGAFFDGSIDEVRISKSARSADWLLTSYTNQNSPSTFYSVGNASSPASAYTRFTQIVQAYKDPAFRFRQAARTWKDVTARFKVEIRAWKDTSSRFKVYANGIGLSPTRFVQNGISILSDPIRFKLIVQGWKTISARSRLIAQAYSLPVLRFRMNVQVWKTIQVRFRQWARVLLDARLRFVSVQAGYKLAAARFVQTVRVWKTVASRFVLRTPVLTSHVIRFVLVRVAFVDSHARFQAIIRGWRTIATRFVLKGDAWALASSRFRQVGRSLKDSPARFVLHILSPANAFAQIRFILGKGFLKDAQIRFRLSARIVRDAKSRFVLRAIITAWSFSAFRFSTSTPVFVEAKLRARIAGTAYKLVPLRAKIAARAWKDAYLRVRISLRAFFDPLVRFKIFGGGYSRATARFLLEGPLFPPYSGSTSETSRYSSDVAETGSYTGTSTEGDLYTGVVGEA